MRTRMTAVTGENPRRAATCTRSVMRMLGWVASVMLATFCVAGVAKSDVERTFEGRWAANNESLTFDLSRCGDGWCGIEVTKAGSCGRTIVRVANATDDSNSQLTGQLELATQAQPYAIGIILYRRNPNDPGTLLISGHTRGDVGTRFEPWRRVYPYQVEFTRVGDTTCTPKVS
jgi:hypothetical protein